MLAGCIVKYGNIYICEVNYLVEICSTTSRSSHLRCSLKKDVLKNIFKFHRKTPVLESLFNKVTGLQTQLY